MKQMKKKGILWLPDHLEALLPLICYSREKPWLHVYRLTECGEVGWKCNKQSPSVLCPKKVPNWVGRWFVEVIWESFIRRDYYYAFSAWYWTKKIPSVIWARQNSPGVLSFNIFKSSESLKFNKMFLGSNLNSRGSCCWSLCKTLWHWKRFRFRSRTKIMQKQ